MAELNPGDILVFSRDSRTSASLMRIKLLERFLVSGVLANNIYRWRFTDLSDGGKESILTEATILRYYTHEKQVTQQELDEAKTGLQQWLKGENGEHTQITGPIRRTNQP